MIDYYTTTTIYLYKTLRNTRENWNKYVIKKTPWSMCYDVGSVPTLNRGKYYIKL